MNLNFKLAHNEDKETLQSLWVQSHAYHHGTDYLVDLNISYKQFTKKHERQLDSFFNGKMEDGEIYIAYNDDIPVGYLWTTLSSSDDDTVTLTEVFGIQKGLGTPAIKKAEEFAKENGRSIISGEVYEESLGFYKKMGFEALEDEPTQRPGLVFCAKYI
jgi:GNAT superfamily N-acetyltransferase